MAQLIMNWKNDGKEYKMPSLPSGMEIKSLPEVENAVEIWVGIIRYMWQNINNDIDAEFFRKTMTEHTGFDEKGCYFLFVKGEPAATITVICDYVKKQGYIHMVSCKPEFRGMGIGHILNNIVIDALKKEGMETAYLTTDDWRLPAIKTYLKAGFIPDVTTEPDFKERWDKIYAQL